MFIRLPIWLVFVGALSFATLGTFPVVVCGVWAVKNRKEIWALIVSVLSPRKWLDPYDGFFGESVTGIPPKGAAGESDIDHVAANELIYVPPVQSNIKKVHS